MMDAPGVPTLCRALRIERRGVIFTSDAENHHARIIHISLSCINASRSVSQTSSRSVGSLFDTKIYEVQ